ncbi:hypothetical protein EZV62_007119 [Acer yangbiense]|uniref:KIB1-4 beta-propeller domain-containing protein n=1 Tax=Acer yangbiense TaxID=1000413 RepID=A0A5C7I9I7_9ROSI|nr:hypothetical protein EZV62_007119 [Acer yangbiense]
MGAYNPALLEWKTHPYPPIEVNNLYLIESPEDGNLFLVPYLGSNSVFRFDRSRMKWFRVGNFMYSDHHKQIEIENLNSIMVFYGADNSSISLTAEGEASELANTVHNGFWLVVYRGRKGESRAQIGNWVVAEFYNWVDQDVSRRVYVDVSGPGDTTWSNLRLDDRFRGLISSVAYLKGVFYCVFQYRFLELPHIATYNLALQEWKIYRCPPFIQRFNLRPHPDVELIDSPDDDGKILVSYCYGEGYVCVFRFDQSQMKWFRIENFMSDSLYNEYQQFKSENLNNRVLFCSSVINNISLRPAAEGEASELAKQLVGYRRCISTSSGERLYYTDQIRFRAVCKNWRSNIYDNIKFADKLPWIMGYKATNKEILSSSIFFLYEPSLKRRYRLKKRILIGAELRASKYGCGEIIKLPTELEHMENINQATFSAAPTSSDCVIFVIFLSNNRADLNSVFTSRLRDTTWRGFCFHGYYGQLIYNMAYANGVFYCAFHVGTGIMGAYNPALLEWKTHPYPPIFQRPYDQYHIFLIESPEDGNLLLYCGSNCVFRFDQSQLKWFRVGNFMYCSDHDHEQIEIENLNNRMIFYGVDNSSISVTAEGEASELANTIHNAFGLCVSTGSRVCVDVSGFKNFFKRDNDIPQTSVSSSPSDKLPWIICYDEVLHNQFSSSSFYLYEPSQKRSYLLKNKFLARAVLHASKFGWLLLSKEKYSPYSSIYFFFYCPFTGEIIQLPKLVMHIINRATFSTAPTSSDCVIFVFHSRSYEPHEFANKFCVSTCSPRDTTWSNLSFNGYFGRQIKKVAYAKGVFYCDFYPFFNRMGAYNPALKEWKTHPYPLGLGFQGHNALDHHLDLIDSPDDGNILLLSYCLSKPHVICVFKFDQSQMKWFRIENFISGSSYKEDNNQQVEIETLNSRILFCSSSFNSISLPAEGEASELADTIHWCTIKECNSRSGCRQRCIDHLVYGKSKVWIQPRRAHKFMTTSMDKPDCWEKFRFFIIGSIVLFWITIYIYSGWGK